MSALLLSLTCPSGQRVDHLALTRCGRTAPPGVVIENACNVDTTGLVLRVMKGEPSFIDNPVEQRRPSRSQKALRMRFILFPLLFVLAACTMPPATRTPAARTAAPRPSSPRVIESFDADWRFTRAASADLSKPDAADTAWRDVNLPHDWSIEGPFDEANPAGGAGAFLPSGIGWYRKSFTLPATDRGRRIFIQFDGVMQNSDVWINGHPLGHRPYGYVSFEYELTEYLRFGPGAVNTLIVRTDTSRQPASRWYAGAGIYRHVHLIKTAPLHLEPWSTFVTTPMAGGRRQNAGAPDEQPIDVRSRIVNPSAQDRRVVLQVTILDPQGSVVGTSKTDVTTVPAGQTADVHDVLKLANPIRWDVTDPELYQAVVAVEADGQVTDSETISFGIRDARFTTENGFVLNGRPLKLLGVCLHHDGGAFGAAVPLAVWEQRLAALRSLGVNAIRTAHNPPAPEFLDLCDRMGFLVMDELFDCWTVAKNPYDYHLFFTDWATVDVRDTVRRDRNHPSVVLYGAGNEIHDTRDAEAAKRTLAELIIAFHENDSRPVTQALFRPNATHDYIDGLADMLDVIGTNYRDRELLAAWRAKPGRKIVGTEQRHDRETWLALRDHPEEAGQFLWTGVDYLGESRGWPTIGNGAGLLDRTGAIKPMARERQSWWTQTPMVAVTRRIAPNEVSMYDPGYEPANAPTRRRQVIFADWTPANPEPHNETVEVYSNCESVELFLNGRSLGSQSLPQNASPRVWTVPYSPGVLRAVARNGGRDVASDEVKTAGEPARVILTADRDTVSNRWEDVVRVTATIVDQAGTVVPSATHRVSFSVSGPGTIVAVDNGDNASHESFQSTTRHAYQGRCVAYIRATVPAGRIAITAAAEKMEPGKVSIQADGN